MRKSQNVQKDESLPFHLHIHTFVYTSIYLLFVFTLDSCTTYPIHTPFRLIQSS